MKMIVGLGNPGQKYHQTRHNIGFIAIDELVHRHNLPLSNKKFNSVYATGLINGEKVILVKPITFMNLSGEAVRPLMDYYNVDLEDLVVIYDDLDLPAGKVRLREKGGHGGHNGIRSLIAHLGTKEFKRIRLGIGRPVSQQPVVDYVLQRFHKEEVPDIVDSVKKAADATETWLKEPFLNVMNDFNR